MHQRQVLAQIQMRKTIDDIAEYQKHEKSDDGHGNEFHGEDVSEILHTVKIKQHFIKNNKGAYPENKAHRTEHENAGPAVFSVSMPQIVYGGKDARSY
jgi:hypothetical protein